MDINDDCFTVSKKFRNDMKKFFNSLGLESKTMNILEIGSYKGYTTQFLGKHFNKVISLENNEEHLKYCREHNKFSNVEYLNFDIYQDKWVFNNIDIVFIDSDHTFEGCKKDIENTLRLKGVRYIVFDDFGVWEGVERIVKEYIKKDILVKEKYIGLTKNINCGSEGLKNGHEGIICRIRPLKTPKIDTWLDWMDKEENKKITPDEAIHPTGKNERDYFISGFVDAYNIIGELNFPYDKKILEFGCGNGRILKHLREFDSWGVDIVPDFVKSCKEQNLKVFELQDLKEEFDIVFSFTVFIHLKKHEAREALKYINKVLKKGGTAHLQIPIYESNRDGCSFIDINTFDEKTFIKMIKEEGFEIKELNKNEGHFSYENFGINHDKFQVLIKN